ncbi:sensor domain-containing diguanylate cyclase [Marinobacter sp. SS21]|uniref:sensor domain-containing diguanylate cyclase n=1 Tax=Marinobacter sp. SS21 TaxID=2979460 RepID=UPI00232DF6EF|nr:diguanylate cyclase [Marinobacter sp. SS21]MDC0663396.1 diguanylate cyclase [Marinobacter sp. SS21]
MKLKHLLIIAFLLISALPLFLGLKYLNQQSGNHTRDLYAQHLSALSNIAKQRILTAVDRIKDNTALVSSRTQMRISLARWNATSGVADQEKITKIIHDAKNGLAHIKDISVFDRNGRLVATTAYQADIEQLDLRLESRASISLTSGEPGLLAISTAPLLLNHDTVGHIRLTFFPEFILELVRDRTGLGETGEWSFAVRHESGDALFAVPLKYDHQAAFTRRVSSDRLDVPITQALLGNEALMSWAPDYTEQPVMASTRYIKELDWGLVAKINEAEVNQVINRNLTLIYAAEMVIILIALVVGIVLSYFIAKPIEKLRAHTSKVARGSLEEPQMMGGWREARELTAHFSFMIKSLRELNESLQLKVDERTKELNEANLRLEQLAIRDPLTGLHNRRYLDARISEEFERAKRYQHPLSVVILDIDHFKSVNDTHGHGMGDEVLKKISNHLKGAIRDSDILARIGGEEFCLVLPECSPKASLAFLERVRVNISEIEFRSDDKVFNVTCSFGVAYLKSCSDAPAELISHADAALYQAKRTGRDRVVQHAAQAEPPVTADP